MIVSCLKQNATLDDCAGICQARSASDVRAAAPVASAQRLSSPIKRPPPFPNISEREAALTNALGCLLECQRAISQANGHYRDFQKIVNTTGEKFFRGETGR